MKQITITAASNQQKKFHPLANKTFNFPTNETNTMQSISGFRAIPNTRGFGAIQILDRP
jgi:hypothetical protein